jgi:hypothetical protein
MPQCPMPSSRRTEVMVEWRRDWLFLALMLAGTVLRFLVALAYRPLLPLLRDAYMYVERAAMWSPAGSFHPFGYPMLLKPFLSADTLGWVAWLQHLAALAMALLLYVLMRRLGVAPNVGAIGVAPLLLDGYQLNIEHQIMSETFCQLFSVIGVVIIAWSERPSTAAVAVAGAFIALAGLTRFPGLAVIVAGAAYLLMRRSGWLRVGALAFGFLVPLGVYGVWFGSHSGSAGLTNRNGFFLYGRVASFADCEEVPVRRALRVFCPRPGFPDPDMAGLFTSGLPDDVRRDPENNALAMEFSRRMIAAMPFEYIRAVASDFTEYLGTTPPHAREPGAVKWLFREGSKRDRQELGPATGIVLTFEVQPDIAGFLARYQRVAWLYGPALGILLGLGALGGVSGWKLRAEGAPAAEALLLTLAAIGLLLFPPVFAVYHVRYVLPALPFIGAAGAVGATALRRGLARA